jgi:hypothetical protein
MKKEIESAIAHAQAINATASAMESIVMLDIIQRLRDALNIAIRFEYARRDETLDDLPEGLFRHVDEE